MVERAATKAPGGSRFADTRWTLVGAAAGSDPARARSALLGLCLQYWYPVYAYLRRCGHGPVVAEDIASAFFEDLLQSRLSPTTDSGRSRFRDFLLDSLHRFLATDWRETGAPQASGVIARPDVEALERRHRSEDEAATPQQAFHRSYALELIAGAHRRLYMEAAHAGREAMFEALAPLLGTPVEPGTLEPLARQLSTRPMVLAIALKRLRQRFQELVGEELAQTVSDDAALVREREELLAMLR